jgi:hypothetical protein
MSTFKRVEFVYSRISYIIERGEMILLQMHLPQLRIKTMEQRAVFMGN